MLTITSRQFWEIFFTKLSFNLKSEGAKTYLGYLWWVLEPALFVATMYVVFGIFLALRSDDFLAFLICGQVAFSWFSRSISHAGGALLAGRGIINQVAIPKPFFPLLTIGQDLVKQSLVFLMAFLFMLFLGREVTWAWLGVFPVIATQLLLIIAGGLFAAAIVPPVPDFKFLIGTGLMVTMWGSGIFYSYEQVLLPQHREIFLMNPMANLIKNYRQVILDNQWPDWTALAVISGCSVVFSIVMIAVYRRFDTAYARLVVQ
ncbi:hypothetical protein F3N42_03175 [Marinihelvus fidelis]|uniref:ABC transmembrane type-2 domain-containing protein n=1 Tax=Marinihelvus fidelis TaxID=2613842 RepID=A0A5N0TFV4_9GAMM|nr:ABC transporter permease [Marinihelvus fidelis]KAA9133364.1 hypothetical protein F3N42_03175 [Marinihelvus fidelis]